MFLKHLSYPWQNKRSLLPLFLFVKCSLCSWFVLSSLPVKQSECSIQFDFHLEWKNDFKFQRLKQFRYIYCKSSSINSKICNKKMIYYTASCYK